MKIKPLKLGVIILLVGAVILLVGAFLRIIKIEHSSFILLLGLLLEITGIVYLIYGIPFKKIKAQLENCDAL